MTPEGLLWTPLRIGATTVKNRIMLSPHRQAYGDDNQPTDRMIAYYVERAKGGVALVDGESTSVSRRLARASAESGPSGWRLTAWEERVIPAFARLAEALHAHDCKIFMEFSTFGVNQGARIDFDDWYPVRGPSRVPSPGGTEIPWEMDQGYIDELVEDYGRSAANMQKAGIDGVEVHAAHGYLPMQFLSPAFNKRTDRYGGTPRRNAQLLVEIGESIRSQVGDEYTVGMRFSFDEYIGDAGVTPELAEEYLDIFAGTGLLRLLQRLQRQLPQLPLRRAGHGVGAAGVPGGLRAARQAGRRGSGEDLPRRPHPGSRHRRAGRSPTAPPTWWPWCAPTWPTRS